MNSISHIRDRLGVTQAAMAKGLCMTQGNISLYEAGQTVPPKVAKRLISYAKELGVTITLDDIYPEPAVSPTAKNLTGETA